MLFIKKRLIHSLFPHSLLTRVEAAEGATIVADAVVGRTDAGRVEVQVVGPGRRTSRTRPTVAAEADEVSRTGIDIDAAATDKSQSGATNIVG